MLTVVATLKVAEGKNAEFEAAFRKGVAEVKANEPDVLYYELVRSQNDPQTYRAIEVYKDDTAFAAHLASDHFKALGGALKTCLAERPVMEKHDDI